MNNIDDNALMLKVKAGNLDLLGLLYERYKRPLFGFFYHMNHDKMLSEDLVQNVFTRVIKYKHSFRGDGHFKTWIFHIARNLNIDHYRKNKKTEPIELLMEHRKVYEYDDDSQDKELELTKLEKALEMLDDEKKELLTLSKLNNMKYKDIGELYDCTEGTIKVKVFRAMKALKAQFELMENIQR